MFEPTPSEPDPWPARPPFFEAFAPLQLIFLGLSLVFLQQFLLGLISTILPDLLLAVLVAVTASLVVLPVGLIARHPGRLVDDLRVAMPAWSQVWWLVVTTLGMVLAVDVLGRWNTSIVEVPEEFQKTMAELTPTSVVDWGLTLLGLCVVVPIGEELVFRGIIQRAARISLHGPTSAVLCGLLFAVLHFEPWYLAPLALMGIVMGAVYEITGTLLAPILVHALYNAVVIVNQAVTGDDSTGDGEPMVESAIGQTEILLAIAGVAASAYALSKLRPCLAWDEPAGSG
jgi:membrane protease YdiL (CAAX protease family)